jgi:hypothetical protein
MISFKTHSTVNCSKFENVLEDGSWEICRKLEIGLMKSFIFYQPAIAGSIITKTVSLY